VSLRGKAAETPEPKGKLDTMNGIPDAVASAPVPVNGPEDGFPEWDQVDWGQAEENVRRLRRRIFAASQAGDLKKVRNLQKLMLRSRSNALVSVRRVTEVNAGRKTAGVDGRIVLASGEKAGLAAWLQRVEAQAGQAGVCAQEQRAPPRARDSRDRRPGAPGPGGERAGA